MLILLYVRFYLKKVNVKAQDEIALLAQFWKNITDKLTYL